MSLRPCSPPPPMGSPLGPKMHPVISPFNEYLYTHTTLLITIGEGDLKF